VLGAWARGGLLVAAALAATSCRDATRESTAPLRLLWHYPSDNACQIVPPVSDGSRVFAAFWDGVVGAFDVGTGAAIWQTTPGGALFDDLRVWGSTLLVQTGLGTTGVDATTGRVLWATAGGSDHPNGVLAIDSSQSLIVSGGWQRLVYGIRAGDGAYAWSLDVGEAGLSAVVAGRTAYVGTRNTQMQPSEAVGHVVAVNLDTRTEQWRFLAPKLGSSSGFAGPLFVSNNVVFGNAANGRTYAVDAATGRELWHFYGAAWLAGPIADENFVYVPSMTDTLYALHRATGSVAWSRELGPGSLYTEPVFLDSATILTKNGPMLYLLARADGRIIWTHSIGFNHICETPLVVGNRIVVDAEDGLYAFEMVGRD
jgi:outer membrane protein assembly factor BamB